MTWYRRAPMIPPMTAQNATLSNASARVLDSASSPEPLRTYRVRPTRAATRTPRAIIRPYMWSGTGPRCSTPSDGLGIDARVPAGSTSIAPDSRRRGSLHQSREAPVGEDLPVRLARGAVRDLVALERHPPHRGPALRTRQTVAVVDPEPVTELRLGEPAGTSPLRVERLGHRGADGVEEPATFLRRQLGQRRV